MLPEQGQLKIGKLKEGAPLVKELTGGQRVRDFAEKLVID